MNGRTADDAMGDLIGTTFAGRQIDAVIDEDVVTTVYRAFDTDGSVVALRLVARDLSDVGGAVSGSYRRFQQHARAALTFRHPHAPDVYEVGEYLGRGYLVTSYIDTMPFGAYVDEHGPLRIEAALELFKQIADVLDAGHRAGLTHGAVSPSTLRVATRADADDVPTAYVTGHGLGDLLRLRLQRDRRHLEVFDGLLYVAPEQLRHQSTTGRTDQYAMACALVHALTGAPPFVRDSVGGLFGAHLFVLPSLDAELATSTAIVKGMAKEPRDRFATCGQLIADIERAHRSAANRRNAAVRRPLLAVANGHRETDEGVHATSGHQSLVVDLDQFPTAKREDGEVGSEPVEATARVVIVDLAEGQAARARAPTSDTTPRADATHTRRQPAATSSGQLRDESARGQQSSATDDLDRIPLSELLTGRPRPVPQAHPRSAWRLPTAWVGAVIAVVILAAAAFWLMGS